MFGGRHRHTGRRRRRAGGVVGVAIVLGGGNTGASAGPAAGPAATATGWPGTGGADGHGHRRRAVNCAGVLDNGAGFDGAHCRRLKSVGVGLLVVLVVVVSKNRRGHRRLVAYYGR